MLLAGVVAERFVRAAELTKEDTVLEIGTGTGMITRLLANLARKVITWEIDQALFQSAARTLAKSTNVESWYGDAFAKENNTKFDVCVTSLPYSESLRFTKWLSFRAGAFRHCVAIVQSEFAQKLTSDSGKDSYRAVSVLAQSSFEIKRLFPITNSSFEPRPSVLSEAVKLTPRQDLQQPFFNAQRMQLLNQLFSFRGRLLSSAAKKIGCQETLPKHLLNLRVIDLTTSDFADLIPRLEASSR